ncbi:oleosin H1-like [Diospyros lotus]|uniref:oleosin H1-like n=1 Tax=Diospyros lotus TaxID=55363 RepID=UPI0022562EAA|nr:oleosin H1-like [Diospyros lotus]
MAERPHPHQLQVHPHHQVHPPHRYDASDKTFFPRRGPSAGELLVVLALLPVGGSLLGLAGITLVGSLIGLAVVTPLFVIFSPVLVPAAIGVFLAVAGVLTSGALGVTGLSSLAWVANCLRQASASMPQQLDEAKRRMQDMAVHMGQKTKEAGQATQNKVQEAAK